MHVPDHDLDRYFLGRAIDESELARIENLLLCCGECADKAKEILVLVATIRSACKQFGAPSVVRTRLTVIKLPM